METQKNKCSFKDHSEITANSYCRECKIYMCKKCENYHSNLFLNHELFNLEKYNEEIFDEICSEKDHNIKLQFFCKTHNQLCCAACISKIKKGNFGNHKDCNVCIIEDIKDEKISQLKDNILYLENFTKNLNESLNNLKKISEKINENKEQLKLKVQKIFTKFRNELNNREDELLVDIDKKFESLFFKEEIIKETEKLPNEIKFALENSKKNNIELNDKKLNLLIIQCIKIEKIIKKVNILNENIKKYEKSNEKEIIFNVEEKEIENFKEYIKKYGILEKDKYNEVELNLDSNIINKDEFNKINEWINSNKNINLELLYRLTKDGKYPIDFHNKCDNQSPTLVIIKNTDGLKIGGYTTSTWNGERRKYDNNSFIFSLTEGKKYPKIENNESIIADKEWGPAFGGGADIGVGCNTDLLSGWSNKGINTFIKKRELTQGKSEFLVEEIEVFLVK